MNGEPSKIVRHDLPIYDCKAKKIMVNPQIDNNKYHLWFTLIYHLWLQWSPVEVALIPWIFGFFGRTPPGAFQNDSAARTWTPGHVPQWWQIYLKSPNMYKNDKNVGFRLVFSWFWWFFDGWEFDAWKPVAMGQLLPQCPVSSPPQQSVTNIRWENPSEVSQNRPWDYAFP